MPEGPELLLASRFVNRACAGLVFAGRVERSARGRGPEVPFACSAYRVSAAARGKELRLTLTPLPGARPARAPLALVFRLGMSGAFRLAPADAPPAHAHLRLLTAPPGPRRALCFVDPRRFGRWAAGAGWGAGRGPCVLGEYERFRENVLRHLADKAFDRPICEALLDQRFFNGIGNYLRAEILFRLRIPPFEKARTVLEALRRRRLNPELTLSQKVRAKLQNPDLLELCHLVPKEVVQLGGKGYGPGSGEDDFAAFRAWLRCYGVRGMSSLRDRRGRTIWFQGDPGPLAPKGGRSCKKKPKGVKQGPEDTSEAPSKGPSRARGARKALPPGQTAAQQPKETSLRQGPEAPPTPKGGKRRKGRAAASGGSPSACSSGALQEGGCAGRRRPRKTKADSPSLEPGDSPSLEPLSKGSPSLPPPLLLPCSGVGGPCGFIATAASTEG